MYLDEYKAQNKPNSQEYLLGWHKTMKVDIGDIA